MMLLPFAQALCKSRYSAPQVVAMVLARDTNPTIGEIATACATSDASASNIIETLQRHSLITKDRNGTDNRKVYIKITSEGLKALDSLENHIKQLSNP